MPFDIDCLTYTLVQIASNKASRELTVGIVAQQLAGSRH